MSESTQKSLRKFYKRFTQPSNEKEPGKVSHTPDKTADKKSKVSISINFYLLDSFDNIKSLKTLDKKDSSNNIILFLFNEGKSIQKIYLLDDLIKVYEFIKVEHKTTRLRTIGMLLPKEKINKKINLQNLLFEEIKKSPLVKAIGVALKIDLEKDEYEIKENNIEEELFKTKFTIITKEKINNSSSQVFNSSKIINEIKDNNIINVINIDNNFSNINKKSNLNIDNSNISNDLSNDNIVKQDKSNSNNKLNKITNNINNENSKNNLSLQELSKKIKEMENQIKNIQETISKITKNKNIEEENSQNLDSSRSSDNNIINMLKNKTSNNTTNVSQSLNSEQNRKNELSPPQNNQQTQDSINLVSNPSSLKIESNYIFSTKGIKNIGSTYFLNATLQCLLHISDLVLYFINEYPNVLSDLNEKNAHIETGGNITKALYELFLGIEHNENNNNNSNTKTKPPNKMIISDRRNKDKDKDKDKNALNLNTENSNENSNSSPNICSPVNFKRVLGYYNPQFRKFENDPKDLILYLLQIMHEELNYCGENYFLPYIGQPNQYNEEETFNYFMNTYNIRNFSIISSLFYGTYRSTTMCCECKKTIYNFHKFEVLSFETDNYQNKIFNIYNGFDEFESSNLLNGNNQIHCGNCKKLCDGENLYNIIHPPNNLIISIDYGSNKKNKRPKKIEFDETIDVTKYVLNSREHIKYKIICVCALLDEENKNKKHFIAYCMNKTINHWYKFNDSFCSQCDSKEIYEGIPYLLFYEKLN